MNNPIKSLSRREWCLWLASLAVVLIANQHEAVAHILAARDISL